MAAWNNVEFLQIRAYSEHVQVKLAAALLVNVYFESSVRLKNESGLIRDAKKLIASLWLHPSDMFRFTTKTAYFTEKHRKQVWLTPRVLKLFMVMRKIGWINDAVPAIPPFASAKSDGSGMAAIYARSIIFKKLLTNLTVVDMDVNPDLPRLQITIEPDDIPDLKEEVVIGVDLSKVKLDKYTQWVVDTLEAQWSLLKTFEINKSDGTRMPWSDLFYHQSTKGKLLRGGRVYAPFCVYPKTERLGITINGDPVGSLDLSQIHPTLLLAMEGLQSEEQLMGKDTPVDAYSMPDYQAFSRGHNKILINILFNAKSEDAAARAFLNTYYWHDPLTNEIRLKTYKGKSNNSRVGNPVFSPNKKTEALRYIESYKNTHPAFNAVICSNRAGDLQALDANIALKVIDVMTQAKLPVLTVHDEFIVRIQDKQFIEMALMLVAKQVLEDVYHGTWPAIKAKWETLQNKSTVWLG